MGAPSRSARAGSRVRSELTTPHQRHQLGFGGSGGTTGPPNEYDVAVVVLNEPAAGITAARLLILNQLDAMNAQNGMRDTTFVVVGYGATDPERPGLPERRGAGVPERRV
jgi:hypothetical protein